MATMKVLKGGLYKKKKEKEQILSFLTNATITDELIKRGIISKEEVELFLKTKILPDDLDERLKRIEKENSFLHKL